MMHPVQWEFYGQGPWYSMLDNGTVISLAGMLCAFILAILLAGGAMCILFVKALRGGGSTRKLRQLDAREAGAFQDLQRGFKRMGERIESLETLLMGRAQNTQSYDREFE